jgi:hypothetical protein
VLDERDLNNQKLSSLEVLPETLEKRLLAGEGFPGLRIPEKEAEHAKKMRFPRSEMTLQKCPPALRPGKRGEDHLQALRHLGRNHKGVEDHSPEVRFLKILQLNDGLDFRDLDEIINSNQVFTSLPVFLAIVS